MTLAAPDELHLLRAMMVIRAFETALKARRDHGFQLLSSGQEAVAAGLCGALDKDDRLFCSGRSIGPALAWGLEPGRVLAELLGKSDGYCGGKGGRGHMAAAAEGFMGAHAVVAGNLTIAAGAALAMRQSGRPGVVACLFGDGACGAGALHETLNLAAIWKLPLLLVCDNNQYSVSTPVSAALAPNPLARLAEPFGVPALTVDGMDVLAVFGAVRDLTAPIRAGGGPAFLEAISYRFDTHSTTTRETRPGAERAGWLARCPIESLAARLHERGRLTAAERSTLNAQVEGLVQDAARFAEAAPWPDPREALTDVV